MRSGTAGLAVLFCLAAAVLYMPSVHASATGQGAPDEALVGEVEQMAQNQKIMMAQLRRVGGQAHKAEEERDTAQLAELSQCRADLSSATSKLQGLRSPRVSDLHRLLSPRGPGGGRAEASRESQRQSQQSHDTLGSETKEILGEEQNPQKLEVEEEHMEIGQLILGTDYDHYFEDFQDQKDTHFVLSVSRLPTEDPIPHAQARLGESLHDDHVEEIVKRVRHLASQARGLQAAYKRFPKTMLEKRYDSAEEVSKVYKKHFDPAFDAYYASAKRLHLTDLQPISPEVGEDAKFGRRRRKCGMPTSAKAVVCYLKKFLSGMGEAVGKIFGLLKMIAVGALKVIGKVIGKFKEAIFGKTGPKACPEVKGSNEKQCKQKTKKEDKKRELGKHAPGSSLPPFLKLGVIQDVMKLAMSCADVESDETRVKCGGKHQTDYKRENGYTLCNNGGGPGTYWLWTERINTRRTPKTWLEQLPDSSECHDQMPGEKKDVHPKEVGKYEDKSPCAPGREHQCKYDLGGSPKKMKDMKPGQFRPKRCRGAHMRMNNTEMDHDYLKLSRGPAHCADRYHPTAMPGDPYDWANNKKTQYGWDSTTQQKSFWHNWDYHRVRHKCEYDNRCVFYDLKWYGNTQGRYRCVPRIHREDPRRFIEDTKTRKLVPEWPRNKPPTINERTMPCFTMATITTASRPTWRMRSGGNRCVQGDGRFWLNDGQWASQDQTAFAKWQRPVQPNMGGEDGVSVSALFPVMNLMASKAYIQAGDICLNYRWNATYHNETEGYLPPTKARCMIGQYRSFSDPNMIGICMKWSPAGTGKWILNVMKPFLKMFPGKLWDAMAPVISGAIGKYVGKALDHLLINGLYLPIIGPLIGVVYGQFMDSVKHWLGVDIRNMINPVHPAMNVRQYQSAADLAIDASQDRMAKVYWKKPSCNEKVKEWGTGCPEAIPVRAAFVSTIRAGDMTDSAYSTLWPGRKYSWTHTKAPYTSYIKSGLCVKVPICDTGLSQWLKSTANGAMYDRAGNSRDCGGHGTCMWNMAKGNRCRCDQGFEERAECGQCVLPGRKCKERGSQTRGNSNSTGHGKINSRSANAMSKERIKKAADDFHREDAAMALTNEALRVEQEAAKKGKKAVGKAQPKVDALKAAADATTASVHSIMNPDSNLGESDAATADERRMTKIVYDEEGGFARWRNGLKISKTYNSYGSKFISDRCKDQTPENCVQKNGCGLEKGRCTDAAEFRCTVQKKILDCLRANKLAPIDVPFYLDGACGRGLLHQKPVMGKVCRDGVRKMELCKEHKDCPRAPSEIAAGGVNGGADIGPAGKAQDGKYRGKRNAFGKCLPRPMWPGCQAGVMKPCADDGMDTVSAMFS